MKNKKPYGREVFQALTTITQFGLYMLVPIVILSAVGVYLDQKFGTSFWMILLFFVGVAAGGRNVFRTARKIYGGSGNKPMEREESDKHEGTSQKK
jgi:F0F1-type ATP synthase assembly protein I